MDIVLHDRLPKAPWMDPALWRLPGMLLLPEQDWLVRDEAFAGQMALRDRLIAERPEEVEATLPQAMPAAVECLDHILEALLADPAYGIDRNTVTRPDGVQVTIDRNRPLATIGRLQQADVCLMQPGAAGHVLTGAVLCFPAYWTLSEKLGRPLSRIHKPVPRYDGSIEKRVQRLFDALQAGRVLWRANAHLHHDPALFAPVREADKPVAGPAPKDAGYLRSERQTLRRLPRTGAVVFTIHTYMIEVNNLTEDQRAALSDAGLQGQ